MDADRHNETASRPASSLGDDMLEGAKAIGAYLGWPVRKVWRARDEGWSIPIRKAEGIGIYAFRSELDAYLRGDATLAPPKVA